MTAPRVCPDGHLRPRLREVTRLHPLYKPTSIAIAAVSTLAVPVYVVVVVIRDAIRKARP